MRIRRIQLVGLAAVLAGGATGTAAAQDLNITATGHGPVTTSTANPGPGNVTVASGGGITLTTAGTTGITVDDSHNATVASGGVITANNLDVTGIHILTGNTGTISNAGSISLIEDHDLTDTDSDGDLDGVIAVGTHRYGILLDAGTHTGNVTNTGSILIEGTQSAGIRLDGFLTGSLTNSSTISVKGSDSYGILIGGGLSGDAILRGTVTATGQHSSALGVTGDIGGVLRINGNWNSTGFLSVALPPTDQSHFEATDIEQSGPVVAINADVGAGVIIEGIGVQDDIDDDGDGITEAAGDTDDDVSATIQQYGSLPAVQIASTATSGNIVISPTTAYTYGFVNRGEILSNSIYDNMEATGLGVTGTATTSVTVANGIDNDGGLGATSHNANAYAMRIGQNANSPLILNRKGIQSELIGDDPDAAYGIALDVGANVQTITNSGFITATVQGLNGDAVTIYDASGSVNTINNFGSLVAAILPLSGTPTASAEAVAIDVSANSTGVTITQDSAAPFTDDDTAPADSSTIAPVQLIGDIRLGSGADLFNLNHGSVSGDISFGAGADIFNINGGATYAGQIDDSGGDLTIHVNNGLLNLRGGQTLISSATFASTGQLRVLLSGNPLDPPVLHSSGTISFAPGATIALNVPNGLPMLDTQEFLRADGGLSGWAQFTTAPITGSGTPYLYNLTIAATSPMAADGAPNGLEATYQLKTASQLGFGTNQGNALPAIIAALRTQSGAADAILAMDNAADFNRAYAQLMPNYASGATELAATAIQQMNGATSNRLASTRLHGLNEVSAWGQEIGYGLTRTPDNSNGLQFRGSGFGFAAGIDGPLDNGALFGLSASFIASEVEEPHRSDGEIAANFGQLNAYLGTSMGVFDLDFILGGGAGKLKSRRFVALGNTFSSIADADWWGFEGHGSARASMPLSLGSWLVVSPQVQLTYVGLSEQGYTEHGGGTAIDYNVGDAFSQRLWADAGVEFSANFRMRGDFNLAPRVYLGYRGNALNGEADRKYNFVSGGPSFTLTDDTLGNGGPLVGIGVDASNGFSTFSLSYEGEFSDQIERHSLNASVRFRF